MSFLFNLSANYTKSIVNNAINVAIQYSLNCSTQLKSDQTVNLENCDFQGEKISIDNVGIGVITCAQDVNNTANIENIVKQALRQSAESAAQQLGILDLGRIAVNIGLNYSDIEQNLTTSILQNFTVNCISDFANKQTFNCKDSKVVATKGLFINNYQKSLTDCTLKAVSQTEAYNQLQQVINQSAVAKEESLFSTSLIIGLIVLGVISIIIVLLKNKAMGGNFSGLSGYNTTTGQNNNRYRLITLGVVIIICIALIIYASLASSNGWWPFKPKTTSGSNSPLATGYQVN